MTSPVDGITLPPDVSAQREWSRLFRQLHANEGRWGLVVLVYRDPARRDAMADAVDRRWPGTRRVVAAATRHIDWMTLENTLAAATAHGARALQILDFDHWLAEPGTDWSRRVGHMNFRREGFADRVAVPVLLWLRPETIRQVSLNAVDLWSWRAGIFEIAEGMTSPVG